MDLVVPLKKQIQYAPGCTPEHRNKEINLLPGKKTYMLL